MYTIWKIFSDYSMFLCSFECKSFEFLDPLVPFSWLWPFSYVWQSETYTTPPGSPLPEQWFLQEGGLSWMQLGWERTLASCCKFASPSFSLGERGSSQPLMWGEFQFVIQVWPLIREPVPCVNFHATSGFEGEGWEGEILGVPTLLFLWNVFS